MERYAKSFKVLVIHTVHPGFINGTIYDPPQALPGMTPVHRARVSLEHGQFGVFPFPTPTLTPSSPLSSAHRARRGPWELEKRDMCYLSITRYGTPWLLDLASCIIFLILRTHCSYRSKKTEYTINLVHSMFFCIQWNFYYCNHILKKWHQEVHLFFIIGKY